MTARAFETQAASVLPQDPVELRVDVLLPRPLGPQRALETNPAVSLFDEVKRLRDDTFHYGSARDEDSIERLRAAMGQFAEEEGVYSLAERDHRAEYADSITAALMIGSTGDENLQTVLEVQVKIVGLIGPLSKFIQAAEFHWLEQQRRDIFRLR